VKRRAPGSKKLLYEPSSKGTSGTPFAGGDARLDGAEGRRRRQSLIRILPSQRNGERKIKKENWGEFKIRTKIRCRLQGGQENRTAGSVVMEASTIYAICAVQMGEFKCQKDSRRGFLKGKSGHF